ncbi:4Fe-4S binding protein [Mangrovibacterium lignilyticum]|uniref:4Fe-4S binding protein n=1 Tax=Mangrovibacterium lignilyticum TaxID=2668052 RepID=UPI0013D01EA2|nr:4Fe-4S binding protein [Mangrovibacterium lignilyticum]
MASFYQLCHIPVVLIGSLTNEFLNSGSSLCGACSECAPTGNTEPFLPFAEFPFFLIVVATASLLLFKKKILARFLWAMGVTIFIGLSICLTNNQQTAQEPFPVLALAAQNNEALAETESITEVENGDFTDDEFAAVNEFDEFVSVDNSEFGSIEEFESNQQQLNSTADTKALIRVAIALLLTIISGIAVRFQQGLKYRWFILLGSLVYLGFYSSGCPCMISSFQNLILLLLGVPIVWTTTIWILGLIVLTYFFGKVWCGWVCHLGAFQEFLYKPTKLTFLKSSKSQKFLRILQYVCLCILIIQLLVTKTNLFIKIDPFKVAFNLLSVNTTGYVLLAILLISSLLSYRPFCRGFCPIGLILGWVTRIPGASKLQISSSCKSCAKCEKQCDSQAINQSANGFSIQQESCILCGECMDECRFQSIGFTHKQTN